MHMEDGMLVFGTRDSGGGSSTKSYQYKGVEVWLGSFGQKKHVDVRFSLYKQAVMVIGSDAFYDVIRALINGPANYDITNTKLIKEANKEISRIVRDLKPDVLIRFMLNVAGKARVKGILEGRNSLRDQLNDLLQPEHDFN